MTDHKWCYCKHSQRQVITGDVITWCDKHNARIFNGDVTLCDDCKLFEQDDKRKAEYDDNWRIPKPTRCYEESVFSSTRGFYKTWVKGDYNGTTSLL